MSARNSRKEKQIRRLRKSLRKSLPAYIDLIDYLTVRRFAKSKREARQMCLGGRVKVASHVVGRLLVDDPIAPGGKKFVLYPYVPAEARGEILVVSA